MTLRELKQLVSLGEGISLEFKRRVPRAERIAKEVIALANKNAPSADGLSRSLLMDLSEKDLLTSLCLELWPDVIVNCAAISNPASVEADPALLPAGSPYAPA